VKQKKQLENGQDLVIKSIYVVRKWILIGNTCVSTYPRLLVEEHLARNKLNIEFKTIQKPPMTCIYYCSCGDVDSWRVSIG
jgi:hypothetical protein